MSSTSFVVATSDEYQYHRRLLNSVCQWLSYQVIIGRKNLIHEASIRYPMVDALTSVHHAATSIVLECDHPAIAGKKIDVGVRVVDPCKDQVVDLMVPLDKSMHFDEYYELKLAREDSRLVSSGEPQRILNDVLRMAFLHHTLMCPCYVMICGTKSDFRWNIVEQHAPDKRVQLATQTQTKSSKNADLDIKEWVPRGLYRNLFSYVAGGKKCPILYANQRRKWGLWEYYTRHLKIDKPLSSMPYKLNIETECMAITTPGRDGDYAGAIWRVKMLHTS